MIEYEIRTTWNIMKILTLITDNVEYVTRMMNGLISLHIMKMELKKISTLLSAQDVVQLTLKKQKSSKTSKVMLYTAKVRNVKIVFIA